jgi:hypothetical protein
MKIYALSAHFGATGVTALAATSNYPDPATRMVEANHANRFTRRLRAKMQGASSKPKQHHDDVGLVYHRPRLPEVARTISDGDHISELPRDQCVD